LVKLNVRGTSQCVSCLLGGFNKETDIPYTILTRDEVVAKNLFKHKKYTLSFTKIATHVRTTRGSSKGNDRLFGIRVTRNLELQYASVDQYHDCLYKNKLTKVTKSLGFLCAVFNTA
jgi:hypothetical protein